MIRTALLLALAASLAACESSPDAWPCPDFETSVQRDLPLVAPLVVLSGEADSELTSCAATVYQDGDYDEATGDTALSGHVVVNCEMSSGGTVQSMVNFGDLRDLEAGDGVTIPFYPTTWVEACATPPCASCASDAGYAELSIGDAVGGAQPWPVAYDADFLREVTLHFDGPSLTSPGCAGTLDLSWELILAVDATMLPQPRPEGYCTPTGWMPGSTSTPEG